MLSAVAVPGAPPSLLDAVAGLDAAILPADRRANLLSRAFELRSGREKPGRYWKIDLEDLSFLPASVERAAEPAIGAPRSSGLIVCSLADAARDHRERLLAAFGHAVDWENGKFAALAAALCNTGAFIYVPQDCVLEEPITIAYDAVGAVFPYTLVVAERGASCTIVERIRGNADSLVCGIAELVCAENAQVTYAAYQTLPETARSFFTRAARPARSASVTWSIAEIGAQLSVTSADVTIDEPGVEAHVNAVFFPRGDQHVDMISTVSHNAGNSRSQTLVKSAGIGRGQGRYLGNIRIARHAQATESSLNDDALLLSAHAHIDSIPALEIAANDVKAYHGATVGALDEEQIFYMMSRGIARTESERLIAIGFFEPVLERFPTDALREDVRRSLQTKVHA